MVATIDNIPVYEASVDGKQDGMIKISLVDRPAVLSDFIALARKEQPQAYRVQDEDRRIVRGVVLRADFPIYRRTESGREYYVLYRSGTIRRLAEKYLEESRQNNINLMHEDGSDTDRVHMVQWFIKDTAAGVSPQGFEDIEDGSLFAEFHVEDDGIWSRVKDGTYRGFSLEGYFSLEQETDQDDTDSIVEGLDGAFSRLFGHFSKDKDMARFKKIRTALAKVLLELGSVTTDRGILSWDGDDDLEAGVNVYIEDEDGNRTQAADGDYRTKDGKVIRVSDGKVGEIVDDEAEVAPKDGDGREERMRRITAAFSESYDEKCRKIYDAIAADGSAGPDFYIAEAGDDYAVVSKWDAHCNQSFVRYSVSWGEDGMPSVSGATEVKPAFVPVGELEQMRADAAEAVTLREQVAERDGRIAELQSEVQKLEKAPAAKPAHEVVKTAATVSETGNRGLDNLSRIMSAE